MLKFVVISLSDTNMKPLFLTLTAMMLVFNSCGQNKKNDMKTLVAYFSATGTTEAVATWAEGLK